jgi:Tfp pilus assembly protein PilN
MVKLNLLPAKVREAELLRLIMAAGVLVYLLALGLIAWRYTVAVRVRSGVEAEIRKVEADLLPLKVIADEVKKLTDEKTEMDAKKAKLAELAKRQAYLVRMLDALPDFLEGGQVFLTKLDEVEDTKTGQRRITLDGAALSIEAWADFYGNLEAQSLVTDLKVESESKTALRGARLVMTFKVSFLLKDPQ